MKEKGSYSPEWPSGYLEAVDKYPEHDEDSVEGIWECLDDWRRYKEGFADLPTKLPATVRQKILEAAAEHIAEFKARILKAAEERDIPYVQRFLKALKTPNHPKPLIKAVRAMIRVFADLMLEKKALTRKQWPTKKEVALRTNEILRWAGRPPITKRHLARCFQASGLSTLRRDTQTKLPDI